MGNARAAEKLLLGDPFTGADAVEMGIANAVLPAAEVVPHARRVAERFNALPPGAVRETKRLMRRAARAADAGGDRRRVRHLRGAAAEPGGQGGVRCLLPEAQARFLPVLSAPGAGRAAARAPGAGARLKLALTPLLVAQALRDPAPGAGAARGGRTPRRPRRARRRRRLRLLVAGDSSAAGVGVAHQDQAVVGYLVRTLRARVAPGRSSGAFAPAPASPRAPCSSCCAAPPPPADVAVVITGVNDVVDQIPVRRALRDRARARRLAARPGAGATSSSPRCRRCTSSRSCREPLRRVVGADARRHDQALARWAATRSDVSARADRRST